MIKKIKLLKQYSTAPQLDWNDDFFEDYDHLELTIFLPQYDNQKSKLLVDYSVSLDGKTLEEGLKSQAEETPDRFYNYREKIISSGEGYAIKELTITLDDDAKANIKLLYYPNKIDRPNLVITGSTSGKGWEFGNDGVFTDTIDSGEFTILKDQ